MPDFNGEREKLGGGKKIGHFEGILFLFNGGTPSLETDGNYIIGSERASVGAGVKSKSKNVLKRAIVPFHDTSPSLLIFMRNEIITMDPDI